MVIAHYTQSSIETTVCCGAKVFVRHSVAHTLMSSAKGAAGPAEVATEAGMLLPRLPSSC